MEGQGQESRQSTRDKAKEEILKLINNPQAIDYVELRVYDIHGYAKGRLLSTSSEENVFEKGTGLAGCITTMGVKGQVNMHPDLWDNMDFANVRMVPITSTLKPCLKSLRGDRNIATVLCELKHDHMKLENLDPRQTAIAQLEQLNQEFGYDSKSAFEAEFCIRERKTNEPLCEHNLTWCALAIMELAQEELVGLTEAMEEVGIKLNTMQLEYGVGQVETTFEPTMGIEAADMAAQFKTAAFVYLQKKGFVAEFMTCVEPNIGCRNGYHLNLSIWDKNGKNVFVDPEDPKKLSKLGLHWLAGMIEHSPAMLAFSSPTINCYRRIAHAFAPTFANWSSGNRNASFRVKIEAGGNVYIENRLSSSACNPHFVLASTLAAGMDGVRRKLELPQPMDESRRLPTTLEEALQALEADTTLKTALGEKMVEHFIHAKRSFEVEEFKAFGELSDEEMLVKEKEYYYVPY